MTPADSTAPAADAASAALDEGAPPNAPLTGASSSWDRVLVGVFWLWAVLLLVATIAQLMGWEGVLDVLDVKRWFAR